MKSESCPICSMPTLHNDLDVCDLYKIHCYRCGKYDLDRTVSISLELHLTNQLKIANISGWLHENQPARITPQNIKKLSSLPTPTVDEKAQKLFNYICKKYPKAGQDINIEPSKMDGIINDSKSGNLSDELSKLATRYLPLLSASWSQDANEFEFILLEYLSKDKKYISFWEKSLITPGGWAYLKSLDELNPESQIAFIAMKFEDNLKRFSDKWVEPAIIEAGYEPIRIDKDIHNKLIDDEIIAKIRQSRFIIADYTGNSAGVYYEAGYARGLGLEVIRLCEKQFLDRGDVHFDQNHYPIIPWENNKGAEFKKSLTHKIIVLIGKGKYVKRQ